MGTIYSPEVKNEGCRAIFANCDGGKLQVRTGAKNASDPAAGAVGTLLVEFSPLATPCTTESAGVATLTDPTTVNGVADGTPGHVRWTKSDNTGAIETDAEIGRIFTVNATTNVVTCSSAHGLPNGEAVVCESTTTLPGGIPSLSTLYVIGASGADLQLALTPGGSAIDITNTGTGVHRLYRDGYVRFRGPVVSGEPVDPQSFTFTFA